MVTATRADVNAGEGSGVDLHCTVKASPMARIYWTSNGRMLSNDDKYRIHLHPHAKHHHNMTTLHIRNVNKDDLGQYECHAENSLGKAKTPITLIYEPEPAQLNECKITEDFYTVVCNWTVISAQSVSEAGVHFKQNGERKWQNDIQSSTIEKIDDNKWE